MGSWTRVFNDGKPYLAMVLMQLSYAVMSIIAKSALDRGMSPHVLVAYRLAVASVVITPFAFVLERKSRPKMTLTIFVKIMLISLLEPVLDHTFFYTGLKYTTATFTSAMCNILPALTFALACIFRLERVEIGRVRSQVKVAGTVVTVGGAMLMTLIKGPILELPWTKGRNHHSGRSGTSRVHNKDLVIGALMLIAGCCCWTCFIISQARILKSYPAKLSLTALICFTGTVEGTILALAMEWHKTSVWRIHWDIKLVAALYGGMVTAFALYTMGSVMKKRGPVFVSAFNPLGMVIVAVLGSIFLAEEMYLGRVIGSIVIVIGLYLVLWGKSKDQPQPTPEGTVARADRQTDAINGCIENPNPESITIER
ncbi:Usually multiple acids move in and out Transporters 15 [Hibiscus trionum]|uniref:WAT1-related protein n=1 Tax=Hibiscus trionum TaxID=183268 RepID=A0A9W7M415_HIBTR|nr:Usually multiple acids move in and out Transporters 15 [Hibiscus trionum]